MQGRREDQKAGGPNDRNFYRKTLSKVIFVVCSASSVFRLCECTLFSTVFVRGVPGLQTQERGDKKIISQV
jgi:hypothetical protein